MSVTEDINNAHWRALGTVVISVVLTTGVLGIGVAIGYNMSAI